MLASSYAPRLGLRMPAADESTGARKEDARSRDKKHTAVDLKNGITGAYLLRLAHTRRLPHPKWRTWRYYAHQGSPTGVS